MAMKTRYTVVDGEVIAEKRSGVRHEYVPDPLGSTVALLDNTQTQTDTFVYWPYGEEASRTGTTPAPFRFVGTAGYYRDSANRNYVRARYLNTQQGKWNAEDPSGFQTYDLNLYTYVSNRVLTWTDPDGHQAQRKHPNPPLTFNPAFWSDLGQIQFRNNCYSYACNRPYNHSVGPGGDSDPGGGGVQPQPGKGKRGYNPNPTGCSDFIKNLLLDGLRKLKGDKCEPGWHKIYIIISINRGRIAGFHFVRQDLNGFWSHKEGNLACSAYDDKGNEIIDPTRSSFDHYNISCGFLCAPN